MKHSSCNSCFELRHYRSLGRIDKHGHTSGSGHQLAQETLVKDID
jgi:hypothetical protein